MQEENARNEQKAKDAQQEKAQLQSQYKALHEKCEEQEREITELTVVSVHAKRDILGLRRSILHQFKWRILGCFCCEEGCCTRGCMCCHDRR